MRPSLKNLSAKAHDAAAGSPVPAGQEPPSVEVASAVPTTAERGSMRKRTRRLSRLREVQLRELGALVVEMRRLERDNPELVARKAAELLALDEELRGLRAALGEGGTVAQVVAAGVAGTCRRCDTLIATDDRFCPRCGLAVEEAPAVVAEAATPVSTEAAPLAGAPAEATPTVEPPPPSAVDAPPPVADAPPPATAPPPPAAAPPPPAAAPPPPPPAAAAAPRDASPAEAAAPPPPPPPPPPAPMDRGQTELTATVPPQP